LHQPDHALLSLVLHEPVVAVVLAERKVAGNGAVVAVLWDAAPTQVCQHHRAGCPRQPGI
jgi:hypothetical protein